ncbi:MAG TPA: MmcQ/YjbR family DNA-binding protein [Rhizomicrobium sp.]|nr:MmcQ/YjbR family DNA-binding protein [Rhizomicrobium sp.]
MVATASIRKFALSLPGVEEVDHFGRPSFRTKKRIFIVLRPDGLNLMVPDERKEFLFAAAPDVFVKKMWGKRPYMLVQLDKIGKAELEGLIREAHADAMPAAKPKRPAKAKTGAGRR